MRATLTLPTLPTYKPDTYCPKCGDAGVSTTYQPNAHCSSYSHRCEAEKVWGTPDCCTSASEHLHRTCQRCHYRWAEAVLAP